MEKTLKSYNETLVNINAFIKKNLLAQIPLSLTLYIPWELQISDTSIIQPALSKKYYYLVPP